MLPVVQEHYAKLRIAIEAALGPKKESSDSAATDAQKEDDIWAAHFKMDLGGYRCPPKPRL